MDTKIRIQVFGANELATAIRRAIPQIGEVIEDTAAVDLAVLTENEKPTEQLGLAKKLIEQSGDTLILVAAEKSEAVVRAIAREVGTGASRVLGVGTVGHSRRFRELIAARCRVAVEDVQGFIAGDSGA